MTKTLEQAVKEYNESDKLGMYSAEVVDGGIEVLLYGKRIGHTFEEVVDFENWAYEGGDSV